MRCIHYLGVSTIDLEHAQLYELVDGLTAALAIDSLVGAYDKIIVIGKAAHSHLTHEEELTEGWSGAEGHKACHERLTKALVMFLVKYPFEEIATGHEEFKADAQFLAQYLEGWLNFHIRFEDSQFVSFLVSKSNATT